VVLYPDHSFSFVHRYLHTGSYTIHVTITDGLGNVGSSSILVTVQKPALPFVVTSYYVHTNNLGPAGKAQGEAMKAANATGGVAVLFFGKAEQSGDGSYGAVAYPPLGFQTNATIAAEAKAYIESFYNASQPGAFLEVAIGTSNCELTAQTTVIDGVQVVTNWRCAGESATGAAHGRAWSTLVSDLNAWILERGFRSKVMAVGAIDAETAWGPASKAVAWANGYSEQGTRYYNFGDAGGCSQAHQTDSTDRTCTTGEGHVWHYSDLAAISWDATAAWPMPQNYRPDGVQARQWANVTLWHFYQLGYAFPFTIFMTQLGACGGAENNRCGDGQGQTGASPSQAWDAFIRVFGEDDITADQLFYLRQVTDITNSSQRLVP
jgi:hypothetical protein